MKPRGPAPSFPPDAGGPALPLPRPYVFKSPWARRAAGSFDAVGGLLFPPLTVAADWRGMRRIAVLRLDHLGDLLQALPALRRLKRALPQAQVDLWVGPWGRELAGLFADVDAVRVTPAPWFRRPDPEPFSRVSELAAGLQAQ